MIVAKVTGTLSQDLVACESANLASSSSFFSLIQTVRLFLCLLKNRSWRSSVFLTGTCAFILSNSFFNKVEYTNGSYSYRIGMPFSWLTFYSDEQKYTVWSCFYSGNKGVNVSILGWLLSLGIYALLGWCVYLLLKRFWKPRATKEQR